MEQRCGACDYDLGGLSHVTRCPECGGTIDWDRVRPEPRSLLQPFATRVFAGYVVALCIVMWMRPFGTPSPILRGLSLVLLALAPPVGVCLVLAKTPHRLTAERVIFAIVAAVAAVPLAFVLAVFAALVAEIVAAVFRGH